MLESYELELASTRHTLEAHMSSVMFFLTPPVTSSDSFENDLSSHTPCEQRLKTHTSTCLRAQAPSYGRPTICNHNCSHPHTQPPTNTIYVLHMCIASLRCDFPGGVVAGSRFTCNEALLFAPRAITSSTPLECFQAFLHQ